MANNLNGTPWILDTADAATIHAGLVKVATIVWSGYTDAAHKAVLQDARGIDVTLDGNTDLSPVTVYLEDCWWARDIKLTTLDSGKVTLFVK